MLKIGEFSKLSHLTIKALRFYEKEGILVPASVDQWTGYRSYETSQLESAAKIKAYRQLDLSIEEIKEVLGGVDVTVIFVEKAKTLQAQKKEMGAECTKLNPGLKCVEPPYEFCEYLDEEHKDTDVLLRHNEAVVSVGVESENIKFRTIPATKVLSILYKGSYDRIGEAYAFIMKYVEDNEYDVAGLSRECYIDGIWNKESVEDWLTEIQLPIK